MNRKLYFDVEKGILDLHALSSAELYRDEIEKIFSRSWLLVAPICWLDRVGAYVVSYLGELPVLAWRGKERIRVFVNRCVGGDGPLFEAERGVANDVFCRCHGWRYRLGGEADSEGVSDSLELSEILSVEAYGGFVFASRDASVPSFSSVIGDFSYWWELIIRQFDGGAEVYSTLPMRTLIDCNWKLAAEAHAGDIYSDVTLCKATREVTGGDRSLVERNGFQVATESGAMVLLEDDKSSRVTAEPRSALRPCIGTLFPNISYDLRGPILHVWHPKGVRRTEVHSYCLVGRAESTDEKERKLKRCQLLFGPTGLQMEDYAFAWESITAVAASSRGRQCNLQMGLGEERRSNLPGLVSDLVSEMNQRVFYAWWQSQLDIPSNYIPGERIRI